MNKGWSIRELGELSDIAYGYTEKAQVEAVGPKFLRITDLQNDSVDWDAVPYCKIDKKEHERHKLLADDIVFARTGATTGKSYLVSNPPDAVCASYLIRLRLRSSDLLPKFLSYYFSTKAYWDAVSTGISGSAQGGFNASKLAGLKIPLPSLPEQRRIVDILDEAFAGLTTATSNADKNLKNARELFDSYLNSTFEKRGPVWVNQTVADVADHCLGKMLDRNKNRGDPKPYLRNLNVRWFDFDLSDMLEMRFEKNEIDRYSAIKGDLLICEGGYPGRAAIWELDKPIFFQKAIHRVRFYAPWLTKWFLYYLYIQDATGKLRSHFTGAGIQHFTGQALGKFELPVPPEIEVNEYVAKFDELAAQTSSLEKIYKEKLEEIGKLKQVISQKAFSGELTSPPSQAIKEAAE